VDLSNPMMQAIVAEVYNSVLQEVEVVADS
jgi:hypothetical protein